MPGGAARSAPVADVWLRSAVDAAGFRQAVRRLVAQGVRPGAERWHVADTPPAQPGLFDPTPEPPAAAPDVAPPLRVPRHWAEPIEWALLHDDPHRFATLYALLWRLQHEPDLRHDPLDPGWLRLQQMAQAVRHDHHKMKAYVRFRPVPRAPPLAPLHVAWFEPAHHVVERAAPFFVQRFAQLHWHILTPRRSVAWDGEQLQFAPGADPAQAPAADAGEALWLTYYAHIFNPARLKLDTMAREMPRRYWKNLPEATLIEPLAATAHERSARMVERTPQAPRRRIVPLATRVEPADGPLPPPDAAAPAAARTAALADTRRAVSACERCPLHAPATQAVFGEGPVDARLMFVGEQPGDQEDLRGRAFVGPAGQAFDRALAELGIERAQVYVTNAVKHFGHELRGTRRLHKTPGQQAVAACLDWLERELALVRPAAVVALGATAARALLGRAVAVTEWRGQWLMRPDGLRVLVTLHPAALLRLPPAQQGEAWRQWLADLAIAAGAAAANG